MFEIARALSLLYAGQIDFLTYISRYYSSKSKGYRLIAKAHAVVTKEFFFKRRDSGEQYIRHLESTAIICAIVLSRLGQHDPALIAAALLHDLLEDVKSWTILQHRKTFGSDVTMLVASVTKDDVALYAGSSVQQLEAYKRKLLEATRRAIIIKLADQLHNQLTLWAKNLHAQKRKLQLANEFYLPLAKKHNILVTELSLAISYSQVSHTIRTLMSPWSAAGA